MRARKVNPELIDKDNPEWTAADFARAIPFAALPKAEQKMLLGLKGAIIEHVTDAEHEAQKRRRQGERGKQVAPTKKMVTMRLSADVLEYFRATGPGWQTRIDEYLKKGIKNKIKRPVPRVARPAVASRKKPTTIKAGRRAAA
jgi:uncharacterized protein (DUF4415 family)